MRTAKLLLILALASCGSGGDGTISVTHDPAAAGKTGLERLTPPEVSIELSAPSRAGRARLRIDGGHRIETLGGSRIVESASRLDAAIESTAGGVHLGVTVLPREGAVVVPLVEGDLRVDDRRHPGKLRVSRSVDGRYRFHVVTDIESYLVGVVPGEIPAAFPRESQRVQAIIARTYALSQAPAALRGDPLRVVDSGLVDQEYVGLPADAGHLRVAKDAVASTRGLVAVVGRSPLRAWYHSTCGGHTCPAGPVFKVPESTALSGVPCANCTASKYFKWDAKVGGADMVAAAGLSGRLEEFKVTGRTAGGRASEFTLKAGGRTAKVNAAEFRLRVGPSVLRSVLLTGLRQEGEDVIVSGRGWGHGVGLCQMGARSLAEGGSGAESIVGTYYPGVRVVELW